MPVNGKRSEAFAICWLLHQGFPHPLFLSSLWRSSTVDVGTRENSALSMVLYAGCLRVNVSAYADDITVFVWPRLDIRAMKTVSEV